MRICARTVALASVARGRGDAEGIDHIDLEAQSCKVWTTWVASLNPTLAAWLRVWRGGAVRTRTRRWRDAAQQCAFCPCRHASARHLWADCPRFDAKRVELQLNVGVAPAWWAEQPRCTAASGWITVGAGPTLRRRAELQVAACRLALKIMEVLAADLLLENSTLGVPPAPAGIDAG
jgi:hypothetical protein